jgi:hypothetical protein
MAADGMQDLQREAVEGGWIVSDAFLGILS